MARFGQFSLPADIYGSPLSLVQPPDNDFNVVANSANTGKPSPEQTVQSLTNKSIEDEIATLYQTLADAQDLGK